MTELAVTELAVTELAETIDRFIGSWNEPDGEHREQVARQLFAADARHCNPTEELVGIIERCVAAVDQTYAAFASAGQRFARDGDPRGHHDGVTFRWRMSATENGDTTASGRMFAVVDCGKKIKLRYQFPDR
ncbi:MAG TPA: hypothetical protein VFE65_15375 [Pseudonocardia sp.]|nr:hypothetical protein [Pseudonocardia sp.]